MPAQTSAVNSRNANVSNSTNGAKSRCGTKEKGENHRRLLLQMLSKEKATSVQRSRENQDSRPRKPLTPGHISDIKWLCWERVQ